MWCLPQASALGEASPDAPTNSIHMARSQRREKTAAERAFGHALSALIARWQTGPLDQAIVDKAFDAIPRLAGYPPAARQSRNRSTYYRLFGIEQGSKYIGEAATHPLQSDHLDKTRQVLKALGYEVPSELGEGFSAWVPYLEGLATSPSESGPLPAGDDRSLRDPQWRIITRPSRIASAMRSLKVLGYTALVGMSGCGKTLLARQVAARARETGWAVLEFDARRALELPLTHHHQIKPDHYVPLWGEVLITLLEQVPPRAPLRPPMLKAIAGFLQKWGAEAGSTPDGGDAPQRREAALLRDLSLLPIPCSLRELAAVLRKFQHSLVAPALIRDLALIARWIPLPVLIVLDDAWGFRVCGDIAAALIQAKNDDSPADGVHLLVTSQERDALAFLGTPTGESATIALDGKDSAFARQIVAAWGGTCSRLSDNR